MTKDEALKFVMPFGKYKGKPLSEIYVEQDSYLQWILENIHPLADRLEEALLVLGFEL